MGDSVEFYVKDRQMPFLTVSSSFQPNDDDLINIKKKTWRVIGRSFTVDNSDSSEKSMRCNVIVECAK